MTSRSESKLVPTKKRKISDTDRAFYKLGVQEGENRLKSRMNILVTTNARLFQELARLDRVEPLPGTGVNLGLDQIKRVIAALKRPKANPYMAGRLQKKLDAAKLRISLEWVP